MKPLLLTLTLIITSCAGLSEYSKYPVYREYDKQEKEPTVLDKLEVCTEKYISKHGVAPKVAYSICNSIYRNRSEGK